MDEYRACPNCGQQVKAGGKFCPKCGSAMPVAVSAAPEQTCPVCGRVVKPGTSFCPGCGSRCGSTGFTPGTVTGGGSGYTADPADNRTVVIPPVAPPIETYPPISWATRQVQELCGSVLALVLTIAMSISVVFDFINWDLLGALPALFICIGCWLCVAGGRKGRLTTTGFTFISVILKIELVLGYILTGVLAIGGLFVVGLTIKAGEMIGAGILIALLLITVPVLRVIYLRQLRKPVLGARKAVQGENGDMRPGMFCIVILIISALFALISFIFTVVGSGLIMEVMYEVFYMLEDMVGSDIDMLYGLLPSASNIVGELAQLVTTICSLVFLFRLRK